MNGIFTFMENNDDECQFSLDQLMMQIEGNYIPQRKTVIQHLLDRYGEAMLSYQRSNKIQSYVLSTLAIRF